MAEKAKRKNYRYTPAFILLFLAIEDQYGAALLHIMRSELPHYNGDSAVVYRALQDLEEAGAVAPYWQTDVAGPARKWYKITARGREQLAGMREDIILRQQNFAYFLTRYDELAT